jgi:hypothetical protein
MSCASCHLNGEQDGRTWDLTNFGEGLRNTIDLRGRGVGHGRKHWSANFDEVQDFENQIRSLGSGLGLMTNADFTATQDTLGAPKAGRSADLDALAAYVDSLTEMGVSPYRNQNASMTTDAISGKQIFKNLNCASCHSGSTFTDSATGLMHDVGTLTTASGKRLNGSLTGLDTPTLGGLWRSAPYLHRGSAKTLREVFTTGGLHQTNTASLSTTQMTQLLAYLLQIDDAEMATISGAPNNNMPAVSFASPSGNVTVTAGSTLYVKVNATDSDGTISRVRLYKDGVELARSEGGAPYEWNASGQSDLELQNLSAGSFTLKATATDNAGAIGESATITVTVNASTQLQAQPSATLSSSSPTTTSSAATLSPSSSSSTSSTAVNDAQFVMSEVPVIVAPGAVFVARVTYINTGSNVWTIAAGYKLGSQSPESNSIWGSNKTDLTTSVFPGESYTFTLSCTAPITPGSYNFQHRMLQEGVEWFGELSDKQVITVTQ